MHPNIVEAITLQRWQRYVRELLSLLVHVVCGCVTDSVEDSSASATLELLESVLLTDVEGDGRVGFGCFVPLNEFIVASRPLESHI